VSGDPTDPAAGLRRLRELFDASADLDPVERERFLSRLAGADAGLRDRLQAMLSDSGRTAPHLASPIAASAPAAGAESAVGTRLGPYFLTRLIGVGGMGSVYEAARADDQFEKRVAIKMVQAGPLGAETLVRFRRERQILASLEHPNIATLLDGGVSPDGTPFLVMEYIDGEPLTAWCDGRKLPLRARLLLFAQVCAAVQYAHSKLVVHRDLKPANILVNPEGQVKLLDFGIARLLGGGEGDPAVPATRAEARAFTPEYASPEQIRGDALGTASDTYSLGVVLFELLAGRRPHSGTDHVAQVRRHGEGSDSVPRPSTVASAAAAGARGLPGQAALRSQLSGDLDAILLKALRPEPAQRFGSAQELADDLRRYLDGLPVRSRHGGTAYRLGKFVRRRGAAVAAAALILATLVGGVIATRREADSARRAQERAERVSGFLSDLLRSVRPETGGRDVPVSELLDAAARQVPALRSKDPDVCQELETVLGDSYLALGRFDEAEREFRGALALGERVFGARSMEVASLLSDLGVVDLDRGEPERADSLLRKALEVGRAAGGEDDTLTATILSNIGTAAHARGDMKAAERWHRQALALRRRLFPPDHHYVISSTSNLAVALGEQGRWAEAESLHRSALAAARTHLTPPDATLAVIENALATALDLQDKIAGADSMYLDVIRQRRALLGEGHPDLAFTEMNYALFCLDRGRIQQAAGISRQVLAARGKSLPESHPAVAAALQALGRAEDRLGHPRGAERALQESLALRRKYLPAGHWLIASSVSALGEHYLIAHDLQRAEPMLVESERALEQQFGAQNQRTQTAIKRLADLYAAKHSPREATRWRSRLRHPTA